MANSLKSKAIYSSWAGRVLLCLGISLLIAMQGFAEPKVPSRATATSSYEHFNEVVDRYWSDGMTALQAGDYVGLSTQIRKIKSFGEEIGIIAFEDYSIDLLALAQGHQATPERAYFLMDLAIELSPHAPRVVLKALPIMHKRGGALAVSRGLLDILSKLHYDSGFELEILKNTIYPVLWACTFGLFFTLMTLLVYGFADLLRGIAQVIPPAFRGVGTPAVAVFLLLVPIICGPLVCVLIWSLVAYAFVHPGRWPLVCTGILLFLWGSLVPIKENIGGWLEEPGIQKILLVRNGSFGRDDLQVIENLLARRRNDPLVWYTYGQLLRQRANYQKAQAAFDKAQEFSDIKGLVAAQQSVIALLLGDVKKSSEYVAAAQAAGLNSPAFLLNASKSAFANSDTELSRELHKQALTGDPELAERIQDLERRHGMQAPLAVAEMQLPFSVLVNSALIAIPGLFERFGIVSGVLIPGATPITLAILGMVWMVIPFLRKPLKRKHYTTYYLRYQPALVVRVLLFFIPGALWVCSDKAVRAFVATSIMALLFFPLVGWPGVLDLVHTEAIPGLAVVYGGIVGALAIIVAACAHAAVRDRKWKLA